MALCIFFLFLSSKSRLCMTKTLAKCCIKIGFRGYSLEFEPFDHFIPKKLWSK